MRCCKLGSTVVQLDDGGDMRVQRLYKAERAAKLRSITFVRSRRR